MPDLLAGISTAARAVHTQYHCLDIFLFAYLVDFFNHLGADNAVAFRVGDFAFGIENGYLVLRLLVGGGQVEVLGIVLQEEELLAVVVVLKFLAHIFFEAQGVDETVLLGIAGQVSAQVVGNGVEFGHVDVAAGGNGVGRCVPNA